MTEPMTPPALFYFPLEPVASRYTSQLCHPLTGWIPSVLNAERWRDVHHINPTVTTAKDIQVGAVLDSVSRCRYSLAQCSSFQALIASGHVKSGDVLYFQDFYTPGMDSIFYTLHLYGIKVRIYAMLHAQSVDPYDFTAPMAPWLRHVELAYQNQMAGIFVASTIHKWQLTKAGFDADKIHVVGLPIDPSDLSKIHAPTGYKRQNVVFSSRLDKEKNPSLMLSTAKAFLRDNPTWTWTITTSSEKFRSYNNQDWIHSLRRAAVTNKRIFLAEGLTKQQYYQILDQSLIQFNCSHQDYVSWTLLEAAHYRCAPVYPRFGSFTELFGSDYLYPMDLSADKLPTAAAKAAEYLSKVANNPYFMRQQVDAGVAVLKKCDAYRRRIAKVVRNGSKTPVNCWEGHL